MYEEINWKQYAEHIFCISYLPNNRLNRISKILENIGIDINDNSFFSFMYDIDHNIFNDEVSSMIKKSWNFLNKNGVFHPLDQDYLFYLGYMTYRVLKIAKYLNYKRIILFEDDITFLKDRQYIKNTLDLTINETFDVCSLQCTFLNGSKGNKEYLLKCGVQDLGNDIFYKYNGNLGIYSGSFLILTENAINKIIEFFEKNDCIVCLDGLEGRKHLFENGIDFMFTLKPLCIQNCMFFDNPMHLNYMNENINISEYI